MLASWASGYRSAHRQGGLHVDDRQGSGGADRRRARLHFDPGNVSLDHAAARGAFGTTEAFARDTKVLAANQGLYNGFLAAGLFWSLFAPPPLGLQLALFFLGCVLVAGIYGGLTANRKILWVQAAPAAVALLVVLLT